MPSQETIDALWALGATAVFLMIIGTFALACVYVTKKWK
ncbi:hypothetical protein MOMMJLID_CDS0042 [Arthrobacter phage 1191A]|nr:hypothetical protein MOMMJLID_CDS0042 [Arthrobacter phage 1191A]